MSIFTTSRKAFLEFLRNLSPQILLLTIAMAIGAKTDLQFNEFTGLAWEQTVIFFLFLSTFFAAATANFLGFIEDSLDIELKKLVQTGAVVPLKPEKTSSLHSKLKQLVSTKKGAVIEMFVIALVVEISLTGVFIMAESGAMAFLKTLAAK